MSLHHIKTAIVAGALIGLTGQAAQADTVTSAWSGATDTTWSNAGNWGGGVPSTTVGALFNSTFTNQPNLTAAQTTLGLWLATGVGQDVTIDAPVARTLTFQTGGATLNGLTGTDILMDDPTNHNLTFGANITLVPSRSSIRVNNAGTLTIAGTLNGQGGSGVQLTGTNSAGVIDITGQLGPNGSTPFGITTITVILENANPNLNNAGVQVNATGTLRLNNTAAIKVGANCYIQGGTLQLRSDTDNDTFTGNFGSTSGASITLNVDRKISGSNNTLKLGTMGTSNGQTVNVTGGNGYNLAINAMTVGNGYASTVTLNPTTANLTIGTMTAPYNAVGAGQTVSLGGTSSGNAITGAISDPVPLPLHPLAINKTNTSTWTLGGANTYTGTTTVTAGTLAVNGSLTGTPSVSVLTGGTLQGAGVINSPVTVTGILSPGNSIGTLTVSSATFSGTGPKQLVVELGAGTSCDLLAVTGNLNITNANLILNGTFSGQSYIIATYGSLTGAAFASMPALPVGYTIDYGTGANSAITLVGIPEPATLGLLAIGGLMMLPRRR
ncbi:MAG: beta strand repeat-containing protein [Phycisphaerales bacterium]